MKARPDPETHANVFKYIDGSGTAVALQDIPLQGAQHSLIVMTGVLPREWLSEINWHREPHWELRGVTRCNTVK